MITSGEQITKKKLKDRAGGDIRCNDDKVSELNHDLIERIKELNCLYGISQLIEKGRITIDEVIHGVVQLIPPAWQYPDVTCVRIKLRDRQFQTQHYRETNWRQAERITVNGKPYGSIEVCYLEDRPFAYEGPFLKEERALLHAIAERLGAIIEYKIAEKNVQLLYEQEKTLRKKLQSEMQSRIYFTRQLIHELKTPLTSLMATSQLLVEETRNTRLEKLAKYVLENSKSLDSRIEELHDLVRGEIGILKLKPKPMDLAELLSSLAEEKQAMAQQYGISIDLELKQPLPKVYADAVRIRQIMDNLINNAFKYAAEGKKVSIRAAQERNNVVVEVQDYGPGIAIRKQRDLFKPGYQALPGAETPGGLGIGLTLSKMLVELHKGSIWFKSKLGEGSSFFFSLPVNQKQRKPK